MSNHKAFLALVRAGLWEEDVHLSSFGDIDYKEVYRLAEEQSVVGLVAAGLEHVKDVKPPHDDILTFVGTALQIEQRNLSVNVFVAKLIERLRDNKIFALLVKGQGIAQCYKRPQWRACGDVDLLLDKENYERAKTFLIPLAQKVENEVRYNLHQGLIINSFEVELHGTLRTTLGKRIDAFIDSIQYRAFQENRIRVWKNAHVEVYLPCPDDDVLFVFLHILQHFFLGGIGLRQICDWSRLLWCYRYIIDIELLKSRLTKLGLISEWKAFGCLAVNYLGMPYYAMPLYSSERRLLRKDNRILSLVLEAGNFGQGRNRDYKKNYPTAIGYLISLGVYLRYSLLLFIIFPVDAIMGWMRMMEAGVKTVIKRLMS